MKKFVPLMVALWAVLVVPSCAPESEIPAQEVAGASAEPLILAPCGLRSSVDRPLMQAYANIASHDGVSMSTCYHDTGFQPNGGYWNAYRCGSGNDWPEFFTFGPRKSDTAFDSDVYMMHAGAQSSFWFGMHCECSGCYAR